jgi:DNA-binding MarR family transcriptional regulator
MLDRVHAVRPRGKFAPLLILNYDPSVRTVARSNCLASKQTARFSLRAGTLPGLLGYRLRLAQQAVFRDFAASVHGLSPGRVGLLIHIDANPGVTQSRLAEAVARDRSTMVGVLDHLEERGLIERRRGADRRTNGLWLTRAGRALLARALREIARHERRIAARLSATERQQLFALLEKISS